ncbi:MAG TPA: glycoside hydrolase family 97 catalytic domain-containing protein [Bacteroidaceae bacterium]|nr:glycoside hydrolase family 97 catalytic domain-containing protein [Bacteroidaceae bacterium]
MKKNPLIALLLAIIISSCYNNNNVIESPSGNIKVVICTEKENGFGPAGFTVLCGKETVFSFVRLGITTDLYDYYSELSMVSLSKKEEFIQDYNMVTGKRSHCVNKGNRCVVQFSNKEGAKINVHFIVFDNGIAFYYQPIDRYQTITEEMTTFIIPQGVERWTQQYKVDYEGFYTFSTEGVISVRPEQNRWGYPALFKMSDSIFALLTESDIRRGNCGSYLSNSDNGNNYKVVLANHIEINDSNLQLPKRIIIMGSLATVVESTLVTDVAEPCTIKDTEWIKPGLAGWIYWAHNHGSKDFQIVKEYIDLANRMDWTYNLIDWEWDEMSNGGDVYDAIEYAKSKGVKPLLWYNSSTNWIGEGAPGPLYRLNSKESREREFAWLHNMGVAGIKVDFFRGDDSETMNYYIDLLEDGATNNLLLNFHGATLPRGWQRTYPNMMTVEGVYGAEWYNNGPRMTNIAPTHNAILPFTRNVVGSMDYTPGTFTDSQFPHITTHSHELALTILFESGIQHMPDRPSTYLNLPIPVKQLLRELPAAWDDTRLLSGYPGDHVVMARRKDNTWYIAGINGTSNTCHMEFSIERITDRDVKAIVISDGESDREFVIAQEQTLPADEPIKISCRPNGGFVISFEIVPL